jgi:hypothetical protein
MDKLFVNLRTTSVLVKPLRVRKVATSQDSARAGEIVVEVPLSIASPISLGIAILETKGLREKEESKAK